MKFKDIINAIVVFSVALSSCSLPIINSDLDKKLPKIEQNNINNGLIQKIKSKSLNNQNIDISINNKEQGKLKIIPNSFNIKSDSNNIVFEETFIKGNSSTFYRTFSVNDVETRYKLFVINGSDNTNKTSSTVIKINGLEKISTRDFNNKVSEIELDNLILNSSNTLELEIKDNKNSQITVIISEDDSVNDIRNLKINKSYPFIGDVLLDNIPFSSVKINGSENEMAFEAGTLIMSFSNTEALNRFKDLYDAEVVDTLDGYYKIKPNLKKAPIKNIGNLLYQLNKYIPEDVNSIEFSSLSAVQTFAISIEYVLNYPSEVKSIELNLAGKSNQAILYDDGLFGNQIADPSNPDNVRNVLKNWWLESTNVPDAWNISMGEGSTAAVIDAGAFNLNHPEMTGRYEIDIDYDDFDNERCIWFFCSQRESGIYHGHYVTMTGFASNSNNIRTAGVAPKAKVIPYHENTPWGWSYAMKKAKERNVSVINLSMGVPTSLLFTALFAEAHISLFTGNKMFLDRLKDTVEAGIPVVAALPDSEIRGGIVSKNQNVDIEFDYTTSNDYVIKASAVSPVEIYTDISYSTSAGSNNPIFNNFDTFINKGNRLKLSANFSAYSNNSFWAPGVWINSSHSRNYNDSYIFNRIVSIDGTSFAAPFISGVIALMKSIKPDLTVDQIKNILRQSSIHYVKSNKDMISDGYTEKDERVRMIDVKQALNLTKGLTIQNIAYSSEKNGISDIYFQNINGNNRTKVTDLQSKATNPLVSPDGSKLAFILHKDNVSEIYLKDLRNNSISRITNDNGYNSKSDMSWSRDSNHLVYISNHDGDSEVYIVKNIGSSNNIIKLTDNTNSELGPIFSPDNAKIYYESTSHNGNSEIFKMNLDGTTKQRITFNTYPQGHLRFSPDGSKLVQIYLSSGRWQISTMDLDGNNFKALTSDTSSHHIFPKWSPDGSKIAFISYKSSSDSDILLINNDGSNKVNFHENLTGINWTFDWADDGNKIIYESTRNSYKDIYSINSNGTNEFNITKSQITDSSINSSPSWFSIQNLDQEPEMKTTKYLLPL
jgi:TolB protein